MNSDLDFDFDVFIESSQKFDLSRETSLISFHKQQVIGAVGIVPIWVDVNVEFVAGFEAIAYGHQTVTGGFDSDFSLEFGARYQNGAWKDVWEYGANFNEHPIVWDNEIGVYARVYVRPQIEVKLESIVGPYLEVEPYCAFEAEVYDARSWSWELYGGIEGNLGFEVAILDWQFANYDAYLEKWEVLIASGSGQDEPPEGDNPIADAGGPYYGKVNEEIQYNGGGFSANSYITDYCWELITKSTCQKNPTETPFQTGTYTIRLKVEDNNGNFSDWDKATVYISDDGDDPDDPDPNDEQPIADAGGPYSTKLNESIELNSTGSYDPDGDEITRWDWDFADGENSSQENPRHSWDEAGVYFPSLRVYANGQWSEWDECRVTVEEDEPEPQTAMIELAVNLEQAPCYINGELVGYGDYHDEYTVGERYVVSWGEVENYRTPSGDDFYLTEDGFSKYYEYELIDDGPDLVLDSLVILNANHEPQTIFYPTQAIFAEAYLRNTGSEDYQMNYILSVLDEMSRERFRDEGNILVRVGYSHGISFDIRRDGIAWPVGQYRVLFSADSISHEEGFVIEPGEYEDTVDVRFDEIRLTLPIRGYYLAGELVQCSFDFVNLGKEGNWNWIISAVDSSSRVVWESWEEEDQYATESGWNRSTGLNLWSVATTPGVWNIHATILSNSTTIPGERPQGLVTADTSLSFEVYDSTELKVEEIYFTNEDGDRLTSFAPGQPFYLIAKVRNTGSNCYVVLHHWVVLRSDGSQVLSARDRNREIVDYETREISTFLYNDTEYWPAGKYTVLFSPEVFHASASATFQIVE
ncbi:hypothetical protein KKF61_06370 [Patescibacteria group bacterium]|nr:hypothetical protein [Patescibacteria group bacterium]